MSKVVRGTKGRASTRPQSAGEYLDSNISTDCKESAQKRVAKQTDNKMGQ